MPRMGPFAQFFVLFSGFIVGSAMINYFMAPRRQGFPKNKHLKIFTIT